MQGITLADYISKRFKSSPKRTLNIVDDTPEIKRRDTSPIANSIYTSRDLCDQKTIFTEYETIEIALNIIHLVDLLHNSNVVHTNLNPEDIFLRDGDINKLCFHNLYHCSWQTGELLANNNIEAELEDGISLFDTRTRNKDFISPEQLVLSNELAEIAYGRNGKIDVSQHEIQDFIQSNFSGKNTKISKLCDIYAIGNIMFKLLTG